MNATRSSATDPPPGAARGRDLAAEALAHPERLGAWSLAHWDRLVRQARQADVLARIATRLYAEGTLAQVPEAPRAHLEAALLLAQAQRAEVQREVGHLARLLNAMGLPLVLLKGAAYLMAGLQAAHGRLFADIDILVPRARLPEVESALMLAGWATSHHSAYDQRYYRDWMHELPPMWHAKRGTTLDVHHAILPLTARLHPRSDLLLDAAVPAQGDPGVRVLAPADMVLHSMSHLVHNDELSHGLRDLSDLDLLLRQFSAEPRFWSGFVDRAQTLGLQRPAFYALQAVCERFHTPVPDAAHDAARRWGPLPGMQAFMAALWRRGLRSHHSSARLPGTSAALLALYVRAHWVKMPPGLLVRHLATKAWKRWAGEEASPTTAKA